MAEESPANIPYGQNRKQFVRIYTPRQPVSAAPPVVVFFHGGFFKAKWDIDSTKVSVLAGEFVSLGLVCVAAEYRDREDGGGWPGSYQDALAVLALVQDLAETSFNFDLRRVIVMGHSAGGTLALWAAHHHNLQGTQFTVQRVVAINAVTDLAAAQRERLSDEGDFADRSIDRTANPAQAQILFAQASPIRLVPLAAAVTLLAARDDQDVPYAHSQRLCHEQASVELLSHKGGHYAALSLGTAAHSDLVSVCLRTLREYSPAWSLQAYGMTSNRGFLLSEPIHSLEHMFAPFAAFECLVRELPGRLAAGSVRVAVCALPPLQLQLFLSFLGHSRRRLERAYLVFSFLTQSFVWGEAPAAQVLPAVLAVPFVSVSERLGRPPILTYSSFNLCNWRLLDPSRPVELGNICRLNNFLGGQDEEHFSMVHVAIEARGGLALQAVMQAADAVDKNDEQQATAALSALSEVLHGVIMILNKMFDKCDSYIYYHRVRRFMTGWTDLPKGSLVYEGLQEQSGQCDSKGRSIRLYGETGAQSSLIPTVDACLGVHTAAGVEGGDSMVPYLIEMQRYMPKPHVRFMQDVSASQVRAFVMKNANKNPQLVAAYDQAVAALHCFRQKHIGLAYEYVRKWDPRKDAEIRGTGGTLFIPYLKSHSQATLAHRINFQHEQEKNKSKRPTSCL
eukprot:gb/GEZN01002538.1/.p1 GENE.gb/GEZN01002538.1/~~gb/GEZN01002538.1/.p1  ORF type:complete len:677 (-),score=93.36 gb/GEZN01002538.1/:326-2356(-)